MSFSNKYIFNRAGVILILVSVGLITTGMYYFKYLSANIAPPDKSVTVNTTSPSITTSNQSDSQFYNTSPPSSANVDQKEALVLYDQGLKLYYQRDYNGGLALFNKALAVDPNCYQAMNGKGASYAFLGRYSEGIKLIKQALTIRHDFEYGYFNLGLANELAGKWTDAISAYQTAIKLDSNDEWAYYGIASIYGRQGNVDMVVQYLQKAIAIDPGVKDCAREEKDFNPVRNHPLFKELIQ